METDSNAFSSWLLFYDFITWECKKMYYFPSKPRQLNICVFSFLFHVLLKPNHIFCACFLQESEWDTTTFSSEQGEFVTLCHLCDTQSPLVHVSFICYSLWLMKPYEIMWNTHFNKWNWGQNKLCGSISVFHWRWKLRNPWSAFSKYWKCSFQQLSRTWFRGHYFPMVAEMINVQQKWTLESSWQESLG